MTKVCTKCKIEKGIDLFFRDKSLRDGRRSECKVCKTATSAEYLKKNRERVNARYRAYNKKHYESLRLKRYNLSLTAYQQMLQDQQGLCKICLGNNKGRKLCVDHRHATGKVRGLLCNKCNTLISLLDNVPLLKAAVAYVQPAS